MSLWDMEYGDDLRQAILTELMTNAQRSYFLGVYNRMGKFIKEHDEFLTFREYFDMYERD